MAKPDGKKPKNRNHEESDSKKNGNGQPRYQKPKKEPKAKGPKPDYTPKSGRDDERKHQRLAQEIAAAQATFPAFTDGIEGDYLIGTNSGETSRSLELTVKMTSGKSGEFLCIERSDGIYIPHVWLFIPFAKCHFALGYIGQEQMEILGFLHDILKKEIKEAKQRYWEEQRSALQTKAPKMETTAAKPAPAAESAEVILIQDAIWQRDCRPIENLLKEDCLGKYNLSDEEGTLIVELRASKHGNEFVVKKITQEHHLAHLLIEGGIVRVSGIEHEVPEMDKHIRGLLALRGIKLHSVRHKHNRHAGVAEKLPNVHEATQLVA